MKFILHKKNWITVNRRSFQIQVRKYCKNNDSRIELGIYDDLKKYEDDEDNILAPDIWSNDPVFIGNVRFVLDDINSDKKRDFYNPTWKDIIFTASEFVKESYIILEELEFKKRSMDGLIVGFVFGS
jgi:hypothetical protein